MSYRPLSVLQKHIIQKEAAWWKANPACGEEEALLVYDHYIPGLTEAAERTDAALGRVKNEKDEE